MDLVRKVVFACRVAVQTTAPFIVSLNPPPSVLILLRKLSHELLRAPLLVAFRDVASMSGPLASASRLKPEIRLAQAVSQFEADLSNEQKTTFHTYRSQSLDSSPNSSDVMRLTAEIDRRASAKVGNRCFGPRFTNFLQVVQQFAALGDIVVGGSQNIIACGVWSLVRMLLLVSVLISLIGFFSY